LPDPVERRTPYWPLLVSLLLFVMDQVTKYLAVRFLGPSAPQHSVPLIGSFLRLTYLENTGVSFGQLQRFSPFISILTLGVVVGMLVGYRRLLTPTRWANTAVGLVLGGALGNLADRVVSGLRVGLQNAYVVDFVDVKYYAVFNAADAAITIGGIIYGVYLIFFRGRPQDSEPAEEAPCPKEEKRPGGD